MLTQSRQEELANLASVTFTGQVNMNDDLIIAGNLVVSGDTTTANSINMVVQDRYTNVS